MEVLPRNDETVLVLGATGKTGRRITDRLKALGRNVRIGSRSAVPAFDWGREEGWSAVLSGVSSAYVNFAPDLAVPGATDAINAFVDAARNHGVQHLVLLSGRGEAEAQACEKIVQQSGVDWTVVRASWFNQNFSEGAFVDMVLGGQITLPAGDMPEPFIDVDDIADVVVAALAEPGHRGIVYEVTGPRLLTMRDVANEFSKAIGRPVDFVDVPHDVFIESMTQSCAPEEVIWLLDYLFSTVLDGRNAHVTDGVAKALGRKPKDFSDFAHQAAEILIGGKII